VAARGRSAGEYAGHARGPGLSSQLAGTWRGPRANVHRGESSSSWRPSGAGRCLLAWGKCPGLSRSRTPRTGRLSDRIVASTNDFAPTHEPCPHPPFRSECQEATRSAASPEAGALCAPGGGNRPVNGGWKQLRGLVPDAGRSMPLGVALASVPVIPMEPASAVCGRCAFGPFC
jgi:hypothetical protein